ncbi:MAG TPA: esterase-like activity of phytase family protein [Sphingomicrobium sp.]|nr:esterase-like activity of phytase family protein [Sphingomicrobium sp.]
MSDWQAMNPEQAVQPKFSIRSAAAGLAMLAAIALFDRWLASIPNRVELGWRSAQIDFRPVPFDARAIAPLRLVGAWRAASSDPRFGGVSALAIDRGRLLALTDSGAVVRFSPPTRSAAPARIGELPDGPGSGDFKRNRDSEALVRDPGGRGWWVAFENHHELWLFDPAFTRALRRIELGGRGWRRNRGIEGAAAERGALLLVHEKGDHLLRVAGSRARSIAIDGARGRISDSAALGDGRFIAIERRLSPLGLRNALVILEKAGSGYRFGRRVALPLGPFDNAEAIAVEQLPNGNRRLWLMTDDNFQRPMRTLLIALDMPAAGQPLSR